MCGEDQREGGRQHKRERTQHNSDEKQKELHVTHEWEKAVCSLTLWSEAANGRWGGGDAQCGTLREMALCNAYVLSDHMEPSSVTYRRGEGLKVAHRRDRLCGSWGAGGSQGDICRSDSMTHGK